MDVNLKTWFQTSISRLARGKATEGRMQAGWVLPAVVKSVSGSIVTVTLDMDTSPWVIPELTLPKVESPWVMSATQPGDKGIVLPASVYMGKTSGLGPGTATMVPGFNLSDAVFVPVSYKANTPPLANASTVQGPEGAVIQTTSGTTSKVEVTQSGITLTYGSKTVTLDSSGLTIDGILFDTHVHGGVSSGSNDTGGPA